MPRHRRQRESPDGLTAKQARFVQEYILDWNATQAAIRAGYSAHTAGAIGKENLRKPLILAAIEAAEANAAKTAGISASYILTRLKQNAERSMQAVEVLDSEGAPTGEYRYDGAVANRALELLGKHLALFADKLEVTGKGGGPLALEAALAKVLAAAGDTEPEAVAFKVAAEKAAEGRRIAMADWDLGVGSDRLAGNGHSNGNGNGHREG